MRRTMMYLGIATSLVIMAVYFARQGFSSGNTQFPKTPVSTNTPPRPNVDMVIALDTSGSMTGLINSARQKLWDIVNEIGQAKPTPRLRVALMTYGSSGTEQDGYVIVQNDLTTNLDEINRKLFELSTSGGTEYVGRVIYRAAKELNWDQDPSTLRQIYVAGNESANQDRTVTTASALKIARQSDIFINALYCGSESDSDAVSWRSVAQKGEGMFAAIDQNHGTVQIATPYDTQLNELSAKLNSTYIGYGPRGTAGAANQVAQDKNALFTHRSTAASRAVAKASSVYNNAGWDLIDARKAKKAVKKEALPTPLKAMSDGELTAFLNKKERERQIIKKEIIKISKKRKMFIAKEMKRQGKSAGHAFDTAVKRALKTQAAAKHIPLK